MEISAMATGQWAGRSNPHYSARTEHKQQKATFRIFSPQHPFTIAMSHHARIEELSDSDPDEVAPSESLPSDFVIAPVSAPTATPSPPVAQMPQMPQMPEPQPQREIPRHYQCLYPVYFDKTRSRAEGRKVGTELAVENPLARDIVDAVQMLGLKVALEPEKLHPKDWANPGRVRVLLKDEDGRLMNSNIKNSTCPVVISPQCAVGDHQWHWIDTN
jgi:signal recognition particle subunit SRP19